MSGEGIMSALDMPEELQFLQDIYWQKCREWQEFERACVTVVEFVLSQQAAPKRDGEAPAR